MHANIGRASQVNIISLFAHKYALLFAIIKNGKEREDTENRKLPETMNISLGISSFNSTDKNTQTKGAAAWEIMKLGNGNKT